MTEQSIIIDNNRMTMKDIVDAICQSEGHILSEKIIDEDLINNLDLAW